MKNTIQTDLTSIFAFRIIKPSLACVVQGQQDSLTLRLPHGPRPGLARPGEAEHDYQLVTPSPSDSGTQVGFNSDARVSTFAALVGAA